MEILNNIWMVLTTPNEFNRQLFTIPFTFLENYICMTLFLTILNIHSDFKNKVLYFVILSSITVISNFFILEPFYVFINFFSSFFLIMLLFKVTPFKALISLVVYVATFGIISTLTLKPYITFFNITAEQLSSIPIYYIGHLLVTYAINCILIIILKCKKIIINVSEDIDTKNKNIIFANFIFGCLALLLQACIIFYYINNLPILITYLSCISLFAYFAISIYSLTRVIKLNLTTKKLESAEEYNRSLCILHDSVRGFKHDFDNIVTTIGGYVRTDDMEGLKKYYIELEDDCQKVNNLYLLNPEIINNPRYL